MTTRSIEAAFPLTPLQEGMLYHTIREPRAGTYHVQCSAYLDGELQSEQFAHAWALAVERHATLRTFFTWEGRERPLQVVRATATLTVDWRNWRGVAPSEQDERWRKLAERDRASGFDLAAAPLARLTIVRLSEQRHRMLWSMHHAIMDGWSALLVLDEVMRDYAELTAGHTPARLTTPRFDRFVGWLESQDRSGDEAYWRRMLTDVGEPLPLPGAQRRRSTGVRSQTRAVLEADETTALHEAAARLRVTVNTMLMGAWALMLARHGGRDDIVFGATVSERPAEIADVDRAAGLYLSTVPVRAPAMRGASLGSWLRALQLELTDARAHGAPGLAAIQRWSGAAGSLFDSLVVFENFPDDGMSAFTSSGSIDASGSGLTLTSATMDVPNDVPLVLLALPGERLALSVIYDPGAVPEYVAVRLPEQLRAALRMLAGDASVLLDTIDVLPRSERALLVDEWSGARSALGVSDDVPDRFAHYVAEQPDAIALRTETSAVTYGALDRHANRLAHRLLAGGIGTDDAVGILAERSVDAIAAMFATLKVGAAYAPLDPNMPSARLNAILPSLAGMFVPNNAGVRAEPNVRTFVLDAAVGEDESAISQPAVASSAAYVVFTSGSTGQPKGVVVERGQLAASNAARDSYYSESPASFLLLSSIAVDSSVAGIFWTLCTGGTLVLPAPHAEQDVESLVALVRRAGVTHTLLVPSLYRTVLDGADARALASLRCVIVAGEACAADVVRLHHSRLATTELHNEYGPSEATVWATAGALRDDDGAPVDIGRPIPGATVHLLDDALRPVPVGSIGELCIGGSAVARGYLGMSDETARRFVTDPFNTTGRIYRTGDRARFLADGRIELLGRADEQIKIRGFRVEPGEIERALGAHPGVREAAVALVRPSIATDTDALVASLMALSSDDAEQLLREVEAIA